MQVINLLLIIYLITEIVTHYNSDCFVMIVAPPLRSSDYPGLATSHVSM